MYILRFCFVSCLTIFKIKFIYFNHNIHLFKTLEHSGTMPFPPCHCFAFDKCMLWMRHKKNLKSQWNIPFFLLFSRFQQGVEEHSSGHRNREGIGPCDHQIFSAKGICVHSTSLHSVLSKF